MIENWCNINLLYIALHVAMCNMELSAVCNEEQEGMPLHSKLVGKCNVSFIALTTVLYMTLHLALHTVLYYVLQCTV